MPSCPPQTACPVVSAAPWSCIEFLSDLHLHDGPGGARTAAAFEQHLQTTQANALFLLGDVFEVWIGDDAAQAGSFEARIANAMHACRAQLYFMAGNRDFLLGEAFAQQARLQLLPDPCCLDLGAQQRWLLTHGDTWCVDDIDYQRFRAQVRSAPWQAALLRKPLPERQAIARAMREASSSKQANMITHADVDHPTALRAMEACGAQVLLHGHTHRPALHHMGNAATPAPAPHHAEQQPLPQGARVVLSDWDLDASIPRADFIRLSRPNPEHPHWQVQRARLNPAAKTFTMQALNGV